MKDLVSVRPSSVRKHLSGWLIGGVVAGLALPFAAPLPAAALPTPDEVGANVAGCAAAGVDLSDCIDAAELAILVELGLAVLPPPSSGNPPIPPVPPVPRV
jgi:hypothetical protein